MQGPQGLHKGFKGLIRPFSALSVTRYLVTRFGNLSLRDLRESRKGERAQVCDSLLLEGPEALQKPMGLASEALLKGIG